MDPKEKVLILYASAGHGHEKAARAVMETFQSEYPEIPAKILDTIDLSPSFFGEVYKQTYLIQIKYIPWAWGGFYYSFDVPWIYWFMKYVRRMMNAPTSQKLVRHILETQPDAILSTHFFSTEVVSRLKERGLYRGKLITLVTDYMAHYVWTANCVDRYCVALPETASDLSGRGVSGEKIQVTGIPTGKKFASVISKKEARQKLSLETDRFTLLLTSGGVGISSIGQIARDLLNVENPPQVLLVCGTNEKLYKELQPLAATHPGFKVYGFVTNMDELMEASDLVVGKAGGLTITECYLKQKPLILYRSIPGQEEKNAKLAAHCGAAFMTDDHRAVVQKVFQLMRDRDTLKTMSEASGSLARPDAAKDIAALLKGSCS